VTGWLRGIPADDLCVGDVPPALEICSDRTSQRDRARNLEAVHTLKAMQTHVVLVHPEIHWNTGNAGRTCLAAGATLHLVEPLGFSLDERQVRRAGLDYWEHVDLRVWPGWDAFERELPSLGEPFFFSTKASRLFWDAQLGAKNDVVLIFGRETAGLPQEMLERHYDRLVSFPLHSPHVRSLNLSTSVALAVYEVLRQRR